MSPGAQPARAAGCFADREAGPVSALRDRLGLALRRWGEPAAVAAGYFAGSLLGLSLQFPGTQISALWPPNALLLAVLLARPPRRWWIYLAAVLPAHLLAQALMGIPFGAMLINFAGNTGEALLGAAAIRRWMEAPPRFDRLQSVILIMVFGGVVAPALMSFVVAQLFVWIGLSTDPWLAWRLRLLTNTLAVFTLVPPLVVALTRGRPPRLAVAPQRSGEAGALLTSLLVLGLLLFALPRFGLEESLFLLYVPLPLLLWAAVRFGLTGVCLSVLTLGGVSMWSIVHGYGPFAGQDPVGNATFLVLFLNVTCAPLLMLAALLAERKSGEEERRQAETLHSAVLASVHDQVAVLDRDGVIVVVNDSWRASSLEPEGTNYLELCRLAARRQESPGQALAGVEAVLAGERRRFQIEWACATTPGAWYEMSVEGLKHPEGGAVLTYTDITSRKQAELEARERGQELAHLTRVAMLGELSGALAHELNQPLTAILSNAQAAQRLLAREPSDLAEVREILHDIAEDDRRAGEVIQRLRAMLKKDGSKATLLDLSEVAREVLRLAHGDLVTRNVTAITQLAADLPPVRGDQVQLQQVLLNLIMNATEAMSDARPGERRLTVTIDRDGEEGVRASIADRGTGIAADELERVFEPFFTTKEQGLGLGLSICRSIVTAHGGRLWASNNEDRGATFFLTLPRCDADANGASA